MDDYSHSPFRASQHENDDVPHILLACTGSVATIKLLDMVTQLSVYNVHIRIILTQSALRFLHHRATSVPIPYASSCGSLLDAPHAVSTIQPPSLLEQVKQCSRVQAIYTDVDEWSEPWTRNAPILHIELRKWADLCVIAPLSANSLAKLAHGMADSLVLSVARAWDTTGLVDPIRSTMTSYLVQSKKHIEDLQAAQPSTQMLPRQPSADNDSEKRRHVKVVIVAPAMNTAMWTHPVTATQMEILQGPWSVQHGGWIHVLQPAVKTLACGDTGVGAMCDVADIVHTIKQYLHLGACINDLV